MGLIVAIAVVLAALAVIAIVHWIAAHLLIVVLLAVSGVAVVTALVRGLGRRTVVSAGALPPAPKRPELPAPAAPQPVPETAPRRDPFTSDGPAWADLIERAEREELLKSGPRERRALRCEGPVCSESLDGQPWELAVEDCGTEERHLFCSRECAEDWQQQDLRKRATT